MGNSNGKNSLFPQLFSLMVAVFRSGDHMMALAGMPWTVLSALAQHCNGEWEAFPKVAELAREICRGERIVQMNLTYLEELKYITRMPRGWGEAPKYTLAWPLPEPSKNRLTPHGASAALGAQDIAPGATSCRDGRKGLRPIKNTIQLRKPSIKESIRRSPVRATPEPKSAAKNRLTDEEALKQEAEMLDAKLGRGAACLLAEMAGNRIGRDAGERFVLALGVEGCLRTRRVVESYGATIVKFGAYWRTAMKEAIKDQATEAKRQAVIVTELKRKDDPVVSYRSGTGKQRDKVLHDAIAALAGRKLEKFRAELIELYPRRAERIGQMTAAELAGNPLARAHMAKWLGLEEA